MGNLVDLRTVLKFLGLDSQTTEDKNLELIRDAVEDWIQNIYCDRTLTETAYKERYDGTGTGILFLDNHPITSLDRLSIGFDEAIRIKNTNVGAHASVSVTSTGVILNKDGTKNTLLFTTYSTMNTLIAAINLLSGWTATLSLSSYGTYPSTLLVERMGLQCINNADVGLDMPELGEYDFEVDADRGIIYSSYGFPEGIKNVYVEYSAGYATIPKALELATLILIKHFYQKRSEESFGITSYSTGGMSVSFENDLPLQARQILDGYIRLLLI